MTGNLKFDAEPDAVQLGAGLTWRAEVGRPVLLLASTREGEEKMLLDSIPGEAKVLVLVVPRHPARFDEVARFAQSRRSRRKSHSRAYRNPAELPPGETCRIEYRGSSWNAINCGTSVIAAGARARIERVDGLTLVVHADA